MNNVRTDRRPGRLFLDLLFSVDFALLLIGMNGARNAFSWPVGPVPRMACVDVAQPLAIGSSLRSLELGILERSRDRVDLVAILALGILWRKLDRCGVSPAWFRSKSSVGSLHRAITKNSTTRSDVVLTYEYRV